MTRFIAWRFMLKSTEKGRFSPMTLFSWLAIGVGVGAMSSLLSVMYGFEGALKDKVLNAFPHVLIQSHAANGKVSVNSALEEKVSLINGVNQVIPYVQNEMILRSQKRSLGAVIWGVPIDKLNKLRFSVKEGDWPREAAQIPQAILGSELATRLGLMVGETFTLISPLKKQGALGMIPQSQIFEVAGVFSSGHYEFDEQYVVLGLEDAQELIGWENYLSGYQVWINDLSQTREVVHSIQTELSPGLEAKSWEVFNSALFQSLKLEQYSMFIILSFAILIAVMNIVITLTMNVVHKKRNIGILRALGSTTQQIRSIFLWQGIFTGGIGLVLGALLTFLFVVYIKYLSHFQLPEIYYDRTLPIELRPLSLVLIYIVACFFIYFSTLLPARQASQLPIISSIRE